MSPSVPADRPAIVGDVAMPLWTAVRRTGRQIPPLQYVAREALIRVADRIQLYVVQGLHAPYRRVDHRAFMRDTPWRMHVDYVTHAATELICREIEERPVAGDIAELGVGTALWARTANRFLPERTLHLFDTFEGFDRRDLEADAREGLSATPPYRVGVVEEDAVRRVLPHPSRAVLHRGWFPDTARDLDDLRFALVHIDVGTRSATLAGLEYFHPRLAPGGTLIVEDYNNRHAPGVRSAVDSFRVGRSVTTTVWPNRGGAIVFLAPEDTPTGTGVP
jgi:hypothetical protein